MKRTKYVPGLILICILALNLTACGSKVADEEQIRQDLELGQEFHFLEDGEQLDEVMIVKRQTDKDQKTDIVWCTVVTNDMEVSYQKDVVLTYGLYDDGWRLDDVDVDPRAQWIFTPLAGIDENDVLASLYGRAVVVDDEEWRITQDNLLRAEVKDQQTDLEGQQDRVTVYLVLDEEVERAEGEIEISYFFDQGWVFASMLSNSELAVGMKEEHALSVSEEAMINELSGTEIEYNGSGLQGRQTVTVGSREVSDFKIEGHTSEQKGCYQIYSCSYNLNKSHVVMRIEAEITYVYRAEDGWTAYVYTTASEVVSTNIAGDWSGTYTDAPWSGTAELHIYEVQEDGTVTATYRFVPETLNQYSYIGSYELSGYWDEESLQLVLEAGEWIEEPGRIDYSNEKHGIVAQLSIEEGQLEGHAQGDRIFRVTSGDSINVADFDDNAVPTVTASGTSTAQNESNLATPEDTPTDHTYDNQQETSGGSSSTLVDGHPQIGHSYNDDPNFPIYEGEKEGYGWSNLWGYLPSNGGTGAIAADSDNPMPTFSPCVYDENGNCIVHEHSGY